jgi:hypothetical protein
MIGSTGNKETMPQAIAPVEKQYAKEIENARPDRRDRRRQRVGVDHGCDRIGGVMESVDEFEAQCDEQGHAEQGRDAVERRDVIRASLARHSCVGLSNGARTTKPALLCQ